MNESQIRELSDRLSTGASIGWRDSDGAVRLLRRPVLFHCDEAKVFISGTLNDYIDLFNVDVDDLVEIKAYYTQG